MPVFPEDPPVAVEPRATLSDDGYRVSHLRCGSHTGTHVDAPSHTEADGADIDAFGIDRFSFDAIKLTLRGLEPRAEIEKSDLPTSDADLLVIETGWDRHWGDSQYFDHPFLTQTAAQHCRDHGYDIGIDALNIDPTPTDTDDSAGFPAHHALLGNGHLIIENLTGLESVPTRFELLAFPLHIRGGDGAPVRAVARYEN